MPCKHAMTTRSLTSPLPTSSVMPPLSAATSFSPFPRLPIELQVIVFELATAEWMLEDLPAEFASSHPFGAYLHVNKSRVEWIVDERGCTMPVGHVKSFLAVLPSMLWVCRLARGVAYDTLIYHRGIYPEEAVWATGPLDLYVEGYYGPCVVDYGLRIQDFRRPGLEDRVAEEDKRIELTKEEAKRKEISPWVNGVLTAGERGGKRGKCGFVMLPANVLYSLYKHE